MVQYTCEKCNKSFTRKSNHITHISKKHNCIISSQITHKSLTNPHKSSPNTHKSSQNTIKYLVNTENTVNDTNYDVNETNNDANKTNNDVNETNNDANNFNQISKCNYCEKQFSRIDNLHRHLRKYCHIKKEQDNAKELILEKLIEQNNKLLEQNTNFINEMEKLKKENAEIKLLIKDKSTTKNITNNANSNNTNNTNNNTFNIIVAYGKEDLKKINYNLITNAIKKGFNSVPNLTETIHFNNAHPEYQNIYIPDKTRPYVMFFDGIKWQLENKDEFLDGLYEKYKDFLEEQYDIICEQYPNLKNKFKTFKKFLDSQDTDNDTDYLSDSDINNKEKYDKTVKSNQLKKLELLLYNNKDKIVTKKLKKTKKNLDLIN